MINVADLARRLTTAVGRPSGQDGPRLKPNDVLTYLRARTATAQATFELDHGASVVRELDRTLASASTR